MKRMLAFFLVLISKLSLAQGGPPLVTDDPETPGNGKWEINILGSLSQSPGNQTYEFPYFDVNYGLGENIQFKLENGWVFKKSTDAGLKSGASSAEIGVKWRFIGEEKNGISVSTYPQYEFHHFFTSEELGEIENRFILPFEASKHFGQIGLTVELGYEWHLTDRADANEALFGLAAGYEIKKEFEVLMDLHGAASAAGSELLILVGLRYGVAENKSLLFSLGHTVKTFPEDVSQFLLTTGMQLLF